MLQCESPGNQASPDLLHFPVVGIGASAGGLEALILFLQNLPGDTGMAFVIVQHLSPDRQSDLAEILAKSTPMPVAEVRDEPEVSPNHVYVIPSGQDMFISGGRLRLLPQEKRSQKNGIDQFFRSLANECGHRGIGVILSGALSDGTLGVEAIKAAGGITFAQDDSARHDSMPKSAIASGCVDSVLPPSEIAGEIARIARHPYVAPEPESAADREDVPHARIAEILFKATGADFRNYKPNSLNRRVQRRMILHRLGSLKEYEDHLEKSPEEAEALFQDILINVTSFFRDPEAFPILSQDVFAPLLAKRSIEDPLRVWTLGCSTGQEAYSIAMSLAECAEKTGSTAAFQIFATDLNSVGIAFARAGVYPKSIVENVSPERLKRFFTEEENGYRICKEIRQRCIFSRHNVLGDPPFSRVDFISCRNVLIYMDSVLQQQIMPLLHYALKPGGFLWLGSSETVGTSRSLFEVEDSRHKIYRRQPGTSRPAVNFQRRPTDDFGSPNVSPRRGMKSSPQVELRREIERILIGKYAPPGVVVSARMQILEYRGDTGRYLSPASGSPSVDLLKMLREGLLVGVRAAILSASETARAVREEGLRVKSEDGYRGVSVEVIPVKTEEMIEGGFLVLFESVPGAGAEEGKEDTPVRSAGADDQIARLEHEVAATREYLQSVIEQHETAHEEFQIANEEAQSANEEMQSVNEELETSKEEIQSSNEELATVNDELNNLNAELSKVNETLRVARDYAESIVASVRSPLLVLGPGFRIKTASASFYETFRSSAAATEDRLIYDLGNGQWNIPSLRFLLEERLPLEERVDGFEVSHHFPGMGLKTLLINARHLATKDGSEPLIILAIEDITIRRTQEDLLAARATSLLEADRSKDEFLAMLAHELRNPLAPLRNATEILKSPETAAKIREQAHTILTRQIDNMSRMLDDLLDVSRITEGKIELRKEVVPLDSVFTSAVSLARVCCDEHGHTLSIAMPSDPIALYADATRLDQAFGNLLTNACKYSGPGSHIEFSAERSDNGGEPSVAIRVKDNGSGISPDLLPRIFDLFVQATRSLDRAHGGLGIGLTLVKRIISLHGGSVEATSEGRGKGSEFIVTLPILAEDPAVVAPVAVVQDPSISRRILIVDDNRDSAMTMAMMQEISGHQTRVAYSGPEAISVAKTFLPEVMILDIGLPGMNGYEVASHLRTLPELLGMSLIALSGYGRDSDRAMAATAGFDHYLVKPADLGILQKWIADIPAVPA